MSCITAESNNKCASAQIAAGPLDSALHMQLQGERKEKEMASTELKQAQRRIDNSGTSSEAATMKGTAGISFSSLCSSDNSLSSSSPVPLVVTVHSNVQIARSLEEEGKWDAALPYWLKACENNEDPAGVAEWRVGNRSWYLSGGMRNVNNEAKAKELWMKSAEKGHKGGKARCYALGLSGYETNETISFQLYEELAKDTMADVDAQFNVGCCYQYSRGVPRDNKQAVEWYQRAARQGHAEAECSLGKCYTLGIGVSRNLDQSKQWYRRAAEHGSTTAQQWLQEY